jgi:hypothetical protein
LVARRRAGGRSQACQSSARAPFCAERGGRRAGGGAGGAAHSAHHAHVRPRVAHVARRAPGRAGGVPARGGAQACGRGAAAGVSQPGAAARGRAGGGGGRRAGLLRDHPPAMEASAAMRCRSWRAVVPIERWLKSTWVLGLSEEEVPLWMDSRSHVASSRACSGAGGAGGCGGLEAGGRGPGVGCSAHVAPRPALTCMSPAERAAE